MPEMRSLSVLLLSVFLIGATLATGIGYSAFQVSKAYIHVRTPERTVGVKGLSERRVSADYASWSIAWWSEELDLEKAKAKTIEMQNYVKAFVGKSQLNEDDWRLSSLTYRKNVYSNRVVTKDISKSVMGKDIVKQTEKTVETTYHKFSGFMEISTEDVQALKKLAARSNDLLSTGFVIQSVPRPVYTYSGLNRIKPEMIEEATLNARKSATRFAEDSGGKLGAIISAKQGNVRFLPLSREGDEKYYPEKIVRVVTSIRYYLKD